MARIGRNDPCPCGSGIKYKKCCIGKAENQLQAAAEKNVQVSLKAEIEKLQEKAIAREKVVYTLGVFVLFTTADGDGWVLEITDMDAVQVASGGEKLDIEIEENPETIEINWPYRFTVKSKKFVTTSYADDEVKIWKDCPSHRIVSAIKKLRKKFPPELLKSIHLDEDDLEIGSEE